jgi:hypothetical protein
MGDGSLFAPGDFVLMLEPCQAKLHRAENVIAEGFVELLLNASERLGLSGERGRNRTFNLLIKSQLLCQLSYAPVNDLRIVVGCGVSCGVSWPCRNLCVPISRSRANTPCGIYQDRF